MLFCYGVLRRAFTTTSIVAQKIQRLWTADEVETLRQFMHQKSDREIASLLVDRSVHSVAGKRKQLTTERRRSVSYSLVPKGGAGCWTDEAVQPLRDEAGPEKTINSITQSFPQSSHASIKYHLIKYGLPYLREQRRELRGLEYKLWTSEEDSTLLQYKHEGMNALAARLQRTPNSVQKRLIVLPRQRENATRPKRFKTWSDADVKLMLDLFTQGCLTRHVVERLQRTPEAIAIKMYRLKLSVRRSRSSSLDPWFLPSHRSTS